jgi:putative transposase
MSKQQKVEVARMLCASRSPINKSQLARVLGIACSSLYVQCKRPKADKALAMRIVAAHEKDDTMGHRKLAAFLGTGKNRVRRVMRKYGIAARRKREARMSIPAKRLRLRLISCVRMRSNGCRMKSSSPIFWKSSWPMAPAFAAVLRLSHRTRQVLGIAFDYHMRADLVTDAIETMTFEVPGSIWHSDQGKQYGALQTRHLLLQKGFVLSMSRAGTPLR